MDLAPYRITRQNTNAGDNSSDDKNYDHIPPQLLPRPASMSNMRLHDHIPPQLPPRPASMRNMRSHDHISPQLPPRPASMSNMRSHGTNLENMHTRSASQHSIRCIHGSNGSTNVTDGGDSCAEIDLANLSRLRQPSDYELVLVRNIGLMSTEGLNSLRPISLPRDEQDAAGKKPGDFDMPNLHPALEKDYKARRNIGYLSSSIPMLDTSHMAETSMSEDEAVSTMKVPNPLYLTSTSSLGILDSSKYNTESWV